MDPFNFSMLMYLSYEIVEVTVFTLSMQHKAYLNFNMFGMRILCTENPELNVKLIKQTCINNKLMDLLKLDRTKLVITGDPLKNQINIGVQKYIQNGVNNLELKEEKEAIELLNKSNDSKKYDTIASLCLDLCDNINIALFTINERKHAKLSLYAKDTTGNSHWILLVDSTQTSKETHASPFAKLGVLTANKNLYALDSNIQNKSSLTFPHQMFINIMNKYKPDIIYDMSQFTNTIQINNAITKDRTYHFLKKHSNIRRVVRNVRVLKDDHVTLSRSATARTATAKKSTIGSKLRKLFGRGKH
uniref:Uncharacterized protein n=1 Tax=viral metagenome TaxID=1070528 RepID=A0A6C0CKU9_9ZZZZ